MANPLTRTWAIARDIDHAVRGGRLPRWLARFVQGVGLLPVARLTTDGRLRLAGGLLARGAAPESFARYVVRCRPRCAGGGGAAGRGLTIIGACRRLSSPPRGSSSHT